MQRTGWVVLSAVLSELVLIGALANQWVSKELLRTVSGDVAGHRLLAESWLTYTWRATPKSHATNAWASELTLIGVVLVVTGLLAWCLSRGARTFWLTFLGTWASVVVATMLGGVARGLVNPDPGAATRVTRAVFGSNGPDARTFVGGLALGLVTGLLTALVAVATREPAVAAPPAPADEPPQSQFFPPRQPPPYYGEQTTRLPPQPAPQPTQRAAEQQTTQFPRPPDDEHL